MKNISFLVEGNDDARFIEKIIKPILLRKDKYFIKNIFQYSTLSPESRKKLINSIKELQQDYVCLHDFDLGPCITQKKERIKEQFKLNIDEECLIIIKIEIESWYLAGITQRISTKLKIPYFPNTDNITKKRFIQITPTGKPKVVFMSELLNVYDSRVACQQNSSFNYFFQKYVN